MEVVLNSYPRLLVHLLVFGICWDPMGCALSLFPKESSTPGAKKYSESEEDSSALPRTRNFWELISSSSDIIPVRNRSSADAILPAQISVETRLQKLEYHFNTLKIYDEDCRQRLLCNLAENPTKFAPLSTALLEETRFSVHPNYLKDFGHITIVYTITKSSFRNSSFVGDEKALASGLLASNQGARLLTYIEAAQKGFARTGCEIWTYRCPQTAISMIDYKSLLVWKELSKWLTVKFVAKRS